MTALGTDAPNVVGLVYIAAFGIDEGESLGALLGAGPRRRRLAHLIVDEQGFGWLPEEDFVEALRRRRRVPTRRGSCTPSSRRCR